MRRNAAIRCLMCASVLSDTSLTSCPSAEARNTSVTGAWSVTFWLEGKPTPSSPNRLELLYIFLHPTAVCPEELISHGRIASGTLGPELPIIPEPGCG